MTPEQFTDQLKAIGWKQSDFCKMTGLNKSTPSRWVTGTIEIPLWVENYLKLTLEITRLYETYVKPSKHAHTHENE